MSVPIKGKPWLTRSLYVQNRALITPAYLDQFRSGWIAWADDGSRVVAHHDELEGLMEVLREKLLSTEETICEFLPPGPEPDCYLGGFFTD